MTWRKVFIRLLKIRKLVKTGMFRPSEIELIEHKLDNIISELEFKLKKRKSL